MSQKDPSWVDNYRDIYNEDRFFAKHWFWDNFDWKRQSIWIGKFNQTNQLPQSNEHIKGFLTNLIDNLRQYKNMHSQVYLKLYFARNNKTMQPEINYLLICNTPQLPDDFKNTLVGITFEKYQLTETLLNKDKDFKKILEHYINWSNFYTYYNLMEELQY